MNTGPFFFLPKIRISLALLLCLVALSACGTQGENAALKPVPDTEAEVETEPSTPSRVGELTPEQQIYVSDFRMDSEDAVGFLSVPNTSISDVVLYSGQSNSYYLRRNLHGQSSFEGVFYADYRSDFGGGTRDDIGLNTCIYGHTLTTDPDDAQAMDLKFGPLHQFQEAEFARQTPYLFFSTESEDMAFEVIAVFIANGDNPDLPYNRNDVGAQEFIELFEHEIKPRSLYHYEDVRLSEADKFLTLSTCIYRLPDGTTLPEKPDSWMRFAVLGRLVSPEEAGKTEAAFTVNEALLLDPPGDWA